MLEFWIFQRKRKMHSNEQNRIITKSYDSDVAFACNHSFWHWFSFFYEQVFVARCSVKIFIFYPWVVVAFGAFNNASFHAGFENACGEREHLSVFEYVHKTWWSKYMHFQIEFQLNNIAFAYFPNLRISGVQKFWIPDTSRQWAMESYSSKCLAKTILFKLSLLNILFGVRLLFFARNPHYARAMNCKWCCTMQMLQIFIFSVLSISVHFFMDRSIAWKTNCQSIHVWKGQHARMHTHRKYRISQHILVFTHFANDRNEHTTVDSIIISQSSAFSFHTLNPIRSRIYRVAFHNSGENVIMQKREMTPIKCN